MPSKVIKYICIVTLLLSFYLHAFWNADKLLNIAILVLTTLFLFPLALSSISTLLTYSFSLRPLIKKKYGLNEFIAKVISNSVVIIVMWLSMIPMAFLTSEIDMDNSSDDFMPIMLLSFSSVCFLVLMIFAPILNKTSTLLKAE